MERSADVYSHLSSTERAKMAFADKSSFNLMKENWLLYYFYFYFSLPLFFPSWEIKNSFINFLQNNYIALFFFVYFSFC